jgi:hypothetical protein
MFILRRVSLKGAGTVIILLITLLILLQVAFSLAGLEQKSRQTGIDSAREAVEKAALQCYALEGAYPPDLDYLAENYGLQLQEKKFLYYYESVAGNLAPVIEVVPR